MASPIESSSGTASEQTVPLGIIAGAGQLPHAIARHCQETGRPFHLLFIEDAAEPNLLTPGMAHDWVRLGAIGTALDILKTNNIEEIIFAGKVHRPSLANLRPDLKATKLLAKLGANFLGKDDTLLRGIVSFFESEGFAVVGIDEAVPEMITPEGVLSERQPSELTLADIDYGIPLAKEISALDIGQSILVQRKQVLGIEAIEGTDALIRRCAELRIDQHGGVLVKVKKPHQERRTDLPTIGVPTVEAIAEAGFTTIAIEAGHSIIIDRAAMIERANTLGVTVIGVDAGE